MPYVVENVVGHNFEGWLQNSILTVLSMTNFLREHLMESMQKCNKMKRPCYKNATYEKAMLKKGNIVNTTLWQISFMKPYKKRTVKVTCL